MKTFEQERRILDCMGRERFLTDADYELLAGFDAATALTPEQNDELTQLWTRLSRLQGRPTL